MPLVTLSSLRASTTNEVTPYRLNTFSLTKMTFPNVLKHIDITKQRCNNKSFPVIFKN